MTLQLTHYTAPDGSEYRAELGQIERSRLGHSDRQGVLTGSLLFKFNGTGQGTGSYVLDAPPTTPGDERMSSAAAGAWITRLLTALSLTDMSEVEGTTAWALREEEGWSVPIIGVVGLDGKHPFIFASLSEAERPSDPQAQENSHHS